ncbi:MAG: DUF3124 domain-containing protein [Winogradskyella sp.]|nr:DUF3124 domain-containing protein [Winogradskyella sp.]
MKKIAILIIVVLFLSSCQDTYDEAEFERINWNARIASKDNRDALETGTSYLSIYSQIYSLSQHKKYNLTAMASLRNTSEKDTIYLLKANYYDTHGQLIKSYINKPVYLLPMETLDIVINEADVSGGTGSNFIFDWQTPIGCPEPIFEAVMSSTVGSQGLSFTTQAKRID